MNSNNMLVCANALMGVSLALTGDMIGGCIALIIAGGLYLTRNREY